MGLDDFTHRAVAAVCVVLIRQPSSLPWPRIVGLVSVTLEQHSSADCCRACQRRRLPGTGLERHLWATALMVSTVIAIAASISAHLGTSILLLGATRARSRSAESQCALTSATFVCLSIAATGRRWIQHRGSCRLPQAR
ncbi:MAG: hypothetical protein H7A20_01720 [Rhodanobacteraceae bacterium]|nr:hypothetical protein [Rhodanobacteraceae bacterium]